MVGIRNINMPNKDGDKTINLVDSTQVNFFSKI